MRQASQFYFHLVWYFCDTLTADCHSILNKFYYEYFYLLFYTLAQHGGGEIASTSMAPKEKQSTISNRVVSSARDITICLIYVSNVNKVCIISICIRQLTILWRWFLFYFEILPLWLGFIWWWCHKWFVNCQFCHLPKNHETLNFLSIKTIRFHVTCLPNHSHQSSIWLWQKQRDREWKT